MPHKDPEQRRIYNTAYTRKKRARFKELGLTYKGKPFKLGKLIIPKSTVKPKPKLGRLLIGRQSKND